MINYIVEVQETEYGDPFIELPDDLLDTLGWQEGDILNWDLKGEGVILTKVHDSSGYELEEDE